MGDYDCHMVWRTFKVSVESSRIPISFRTTQVLHYIWNENYSKKRAGVGVGCRCGSVDRVLTNLAGITPRFDLQHYVKN